MDSEDAPLLREASPRQLAGVMDAGLGEIRPEAVSHLRHAAADADDTPEVAGYRLLERVGEGGMGVVFMAEQLRPVRRRVALKLVKPGLDTRQVIARFDAERQALAMMDHPNIAKVFDAGATAAGQPYFVMELVRGVPITDYCDRYRPATRQRLRLFVRVCEAVQHAHQKGVIHRDLKPSNVLVTRADDGTPIPKVIDFGLAKATEGRPLTDHTLFTQFRQLVGTPMYMSPEQAEMSPLLDVDTRADVYGLGVLLYEMLTGATPFDRRRIAGADYAEVLRIVREEDPPTPSARLSGSGDKPSDASGRRRAGPRRRTDEIRGELDWIVMRAMDKDRRRRYQTASELAQDLGRYLADEPVQACPPSPAYRLRKFVRRNKALMATTGAVAAVLVIATGVSAWQATRAVRAERQVLRERDEAVAAQRLAREQAAVAGAVNEFLNRDLLGQASVFNQIEAGMAPDRDLTVREAMDRAARRLSGGAVTQPQVEAGVRNTIGRVYVHLGEVDKAEHQFEAALGLRRGAASPAGAEHFDALCGLAWVKLQRNYLRQTEALLDEATALSAGPLPDPDKRRLEADLLRAGVYLNRSTDARAEPLVVDCLARARRLYGSRHRATMDVAMSLALFYTETGRLDQAEELAAEAWRVLRDDVGEHHPATYRAVEQLAAVCQGQGRLDEAARLLSQAVTGWQKLVGDRHPSTSRAKLMLARLHVQAGRPDEARSLATAVVRDNPDDHMALYYLAALQLFSGDHEGHLAACRALLNRFGDTSEKRIATRVARACLLRAGVRETVGAGEVGRLADQAIEGDDAPTFQLTKGLAEYRAGNLDVAAGWLRGSRDGFAEVLSRPAGRAENVFGCIHAVAGYYLAAVEQRRGRLEAATAALRSAQNQLQKATPGSVGSHDWLIAHIASRDAEAVFAEEAAPTGSASP